MINKPVRTPAIFLMILLLLNVQFVALPGDANAGEVSANTNANMEAAAVSISSALQQTVDNSKPFVAGDGIWIYTFPDTSSFLNRPFPIDNNGMIDFPMIGKVRVTDMSVSELENFLKTQFRSYLKFPTLRVKPMIRISVLGGVPRPGLFYVHNDQSLWEVMNYVGGTVSEDGLKEMQLERDNDIVYEDLIPFFEKGVSLKNMGIKSGDQIWVPSPDRPSIWQEIKEVMPLVTFSTSLFFFYLSYQQQVQAAKAR